MELGQFLYEREAKAQPTLSVTDGVIALREWLKNAIQILRRNSRAIIANREQQFLRGALRSKR